MHGGRYAGPGLRSLSRLWGGGAFALCARGDGDRLQGSLRTDPAPLGVFWRYAGSVLRSLSRLWGGGAFALCARVFGDRLQGSLQPDPAAAGTDEWWDPTSPKHFRGRAISPKAPRPQTRTALEMGPHPGAPQAASGEPKTNSAEPDLRSLMRLRQGGTFTRCAQCAGVCLQGSLRSDPAVAGTVLCGRQSLRVSQQQRSSISWTPAAWKRGFPSSARTARVSMAKRSPKRLSMVGASMDQGGPAMRDWS